MELRDQTAVILHQVSHPIEQAKGLPNACYTADDAFSMDRDQVISPAWACIGFIDELPEQNYAVPKDFMGLPLLLTRDSADVVRVFHNVCSHRGLQLADAPCKTNGSLRCPYHSWTYAMDGRLRGTPNIGGYGQHTHPDFDNRLHGLREVRSETWLGAIFVNLDGKAEPFSDYVAPIRESWARLVDLEALSQFSISAEGSRMSLTVQSNWKLAVENYLESYHLPTVHPELNRISPLPEHYCVEPFSHGAGQGSMNYSPLELNGKTLPKLDNWNTELAHVGEYPVLFPNTFFGIHSDHLFLLYLQPLSNSETIEHVRILYLPDGAEQADYKALRETVLQNWEKVFKEDIFAVERMQKGRLSPAFTGGVFSPEMDAPTLHFHRWVAKALHQQK